MYLAGRGCYEAGELARAKKHIAHPWPRAFRGETHRQNVPRPPNNRLQAPGAWQEKRHWQLRCGAGGSWGGIIAGGRCTVPGGKGEGPCRDLPSPGHARRAGRAGYARRALPDANPGCAMRCGCFSLGKEPCSSEIFSFACPPASFPPPAPSPPVKTFVSAAPGQVSADAWGCTGCWAVPLQVHCLDETSAAPCLSFPTCKTAGAMLCYSWKALGEPCLQKCHSYRSSNPPFPCQGKLMRFILWYKVAAA